MNVVDKICMALAFPIGLILLILGAIGLFTGCRAHFSLPPVLGLVPGIVGWGIVRAIYLAWNRNPPAPLQPDSKPPWNDQWPSQP